MLSLRLGEVSFFFLSLHPCTALPTPIRPQGLVLGTVLGEKGEPEGHTVSSVLQGLR